MYLGFLDIFMTSEKEQKFTQIKIDKKIRMLKLSKTGGESYYKKTNFGLKNKKIQISRKGCLSKYRCHGSDNLGEQEALTSKYSQLNFGKGHQIWWLLSYEWFRNFTFGGCINLMAVITVAIALLTTASSFFGCLHSRTSSLRSMLHSCCTGLMKRAILDRWSRGTKTLGTRVWLTYGNLRTLSRSS